jgi:hypothetical protein
MPSAGVDRPADGVGAATRLRRCAWGLVLVAALFTAVQMATVPLRLPLGWDEVVYTSQVAVRAPASYFDAPRARGVSLLAGVAAGLNPSTAVLRGWMSLLAGGGLVAAYWPWRRLVAGPVVVLAAALFASLWVVEFYADEVMPNIYVAYGTVAAVGWFLVAASQPRPARWASVALAVSIAFTALVRPTDAVFLAAPLFVAGLAVRAWRRVSVLVSLGSGLVTGLLPWIVEAYVRFGGPLARLRQGSLEQDGMGLHNAIGMELRALNGPMLCRPCNVPWTHTQLSLWWLALPLLALAGVLLAARGSGGGTLLLPTVCAAVVSIQYLLLIDYAAPRFLMPVYTLLALPVAACLAAIVRMAPARWRPAVTGAVALVLVAHAASQYAVLHRRAVREVSARAQISDLAGRLSEAGLRAPCTLAGSDMLQTAFDAGCSWQPIADASAREVIVQKADQPRPEVARVWNHCSLRLNDGSTWDIYLAPAFGTLRRC